MPQHYGTEFVGGHDLAAGPSFGLHGLMVELNGFRRWDIDLELETSGTLKLLFLQDFSPLDQGDFIAQDGRLLAYCRLVDQDDGQCKAGFNETP
jgi:hypothetical protein